MRYLAQAVFDKDTAAMIESGPFKSDRVLVIYLPDCHESLAGIIAGRITGAEHETDMISRQRLVLQPVHLKQRFQSEILRMRWQSRLPEN